MPSGLTLHGIVRHLENVERSWLREFFDGQADLLPRDAEGDFRVEGVPMSELLASYSKEAWRCNEVIGAAASLDSTATDEEGTYSLRWILLHLIEETGRHLGHIDLLREHADGAVGEDPSDV